MHLALVVTDAVSFNTLMRGQLEYLKESGIQVTLFCGGSSHERRRLELRNVGRVRFVRFKRKPHVFWDLVGLVQLIWAFSRSDFDGVVSSTPKAMLLGSIAGFLSRVPNRTALVRGRAYEQSTGLIRKVFLAFDRITFAISHQVLFISPSLLAAFKNDGASLVRKGRVLGFGSSNGVNLFRFRPPTSDEERRDLRIRYGIRTHAFVILVVGRIARDKGVAEIGQLIESLHAYSELVWVFVGDVEEDDCFAPIKAARSADVIHVGRSDEVDSWFRAGDLHVFLSRREGFGNVAIEAAATSVPTFAFDVVGVRDSVVHGITGLLFPPEDGVGPIAREISNALTDRTKFAARFPLARPIVAERYDRRIVWKRYAEAYLGQKWRGGVRPEQ